VIGAGRLKYLDDGEVVFSVIAENSTREPHRSLSQHWRRYSADRNTYGYLSEHHSFGETRSRPENMPRNWRQKCSPPRSMWTSTRHSWDEKKEIYRISNKIVRTSNITQSAVGDKRASGPPPSPAVLILEV